MSQGDGHPSVRVTYFLQDEKGWGQYVTAEGRIRRLDPSFRVLVLEDRREIPLGDIVELEDGQVQ